VADRLEALQRIIGELAQMRVDDKGIRNEQQGIAVWRCFRDGFGGDDGTGPGAVSIIIVALCWRAISSASRRARILMPPPGPNGTTNLIVA
jgi:hypothetical protein